MKEDIENRASEFGKNTDRERNIEWQQPKVSLKLCGGSVKMGIENICIHAKGDSYE